MARQPLNGDLNRFLERQYAGIRHVKEFCVVGQPTRDGLGEEPVAVIVADRDAADAPKDPRALERAIRKEFSSRTAQVSRNSCAEIGLLTFAAFPADWSRYRTNRGPARHQSGHRFAGIPADPHRGCGSC